MRDQLSKAYSKRLFIILSLFFLVMTVALTVVQTTKQQNLQSSAAVGLTNCNVGDELIANDSEEQKMIRLINEYRDEDVLFELTPQENLNRAAAWQSKDMAQRDKMDHKDSTGRSALDRILDCGYDDFLEAHENIGEGDDADADKIFKAWKNSPDHRANMLCENCEHIGVARDKKGGNGKWYWTMTVGALPSEVEPDPEVSEDPEPSDEPTDEEEEEEPETTPTPEVTLPPAQTTLPEGTTGVYAKVFLTGINIIGASPPLHPNRPLTVTVLTPENEPVAEVNGVISFDPEDSLFKGAVALPTTVESGTYQIKIKTDRSLEKIVSSGFMHIEKGKMLNLTPTFIQNADLDGNNVINFADVLVFRKCLSGETKCANADVDLNDDGEKNIADYGVFLLIFGLVPGE